MLVKAKISDKDWIVALLSEVYKENPTVLFAAKGNKKKIKKVFSYSFDIFFSQEGVYYHPNKKGVVFFKMGTGQTQKRLFKSVFFLLFVSGIKNGLKLLKRQKTLKKEHPKGMFMHIGVFGIKVHPERNRTARDIRNFIFDFAIESKTDIYLETPMEKTKRVYEYYGFNCYRKIYLKETGHFWYLMKSELQDVTNIRKIFS